MKKIEVDIPIHYWIWTRWYPTVWAKINQNFVDVR